MIRLPNIPGLQNTAINNPQADPRAAMAPALALGKTAEAIAGVAQEFHQSALQVQKLENARVVSQKRMDISEEYANLQTELGKDPDPASRINRTREFFTQKKGTIEDPELPPAVQHELGQYFDRFASQSMIRQGEDSARLAITRATKTLQNEIQFGVKNRNIDHLKSAFGTALASGAVLPEDITRMEGEAIKQINFNDVVDAIDADPLGARHKITQDAFRQQYPDLDDESIRRLQSHAEQKANEYQNNFANDLIIAGQNPTIEELKAMEETGQVSKSDAARWIGKIRSNVQPAHDPALYQHHFNEIMSYNRGTDTTRQGESILRNRLASENLPPSDIKILNDLLNDRIDPAKADSPRGKMDSEFSSRINSDFQRGEFGKFRFFQDHDNDRMTPTVEAINNEEWSKSWNLRGKFAEQWRATLDSMPENASFTDMENAYGALKQSYQEKKPAPKLNFKSAQPRPLDPDTTYKPTSSTSKTFGGQPVKPPGVPYQNAAGTVFGGPNDPADNGRSAFGGKTGAGAKEGTAIPQALLESKFPGKDKAWLGDNVRTVVRGPDGVTHVFPVVDLGTAEWVWQKNARPTLDFTEGAARQAGGRPTYTQDGKLKGLAGLDNLEFSVVSVDIGNADLGALSWEDAKDAWFKTNKTRNPVTAQNSLIALQEEWHQAHAAQQ